MKALPARRERHIGERQPKGLQERLANTEGGAPTGKRKGRVAVVDGTNVTIVTFRQGDVRSVESRAYDTPEEAFDDAAKTTRKKTGGIIVWAGEYEQQIIKSEPYDPKIAELALGEELLMVFGGEDMLCASVPGIALRADLPGKAKTPVVPAAFCVGGQDGAWVRVGHTQSDVTLVVDGAVRSVQKFAHGIDDYATGGGRDPTETLEEEARKISSRLQTQLAEWLAHYASVPYIWLHGPGDDPRGVLAAVMRDETGRRVRTPCNGFGVAAGAVMDRADIPAAVHAAGAPRLRNPRRLITAAKRRTARARAGAASAAAAVLIGMAWLSHSRDQSAKNEQARLRALKETHEAAIDHEAAELSDRAESARQALEAIAATETDDPNWPLLVLLAGDEQMSAGRNAITLTLAGSDLIAGYAQDLVSMDELAVAVFGVGAYATSGDSVSVDEEGKTGGSVNAGEQEQE